MKQNIFQVPDGSIIRTKTLMLYRVLRIQDNVNLIDSEGHRLPVVNKSLMVNVVLAADEVEQVKAMLVPPGQLIVGMRRLLPSELEAESWDCDNGSPVLVMGDGSLIYASEDCEGNGPGALFIRSTNGERGALSIDKEEENND